MFIDVFKKFRFGVAIYQLIDGLNTLFRKPSLQLILYISWNLNQTKKTFWPTDLELGYLVWATHKLKMFIKQT